jgi:squalene-hopene/tetraprenyl-beta-curcumene cyclase
MFPRILSLLILAPFIVSAGDWNKQLAADYLDARQKDWLAWPRANKNGFPCVSCHTGIPYLLARPALRQALGESGPTKYEAALLDTLRSRLDKKTPAEMFPSAIASYAATAASVESIFAALLLTADSSGGKLSGDAERAFDRMWSLQLREGDLSGAWGWFAQDLDPWEMPESRYYGAALAAVAAGMAPPEYRSRPEVRENIARLRKYLCDGQAGQPLHNRLTLLWAAALIPDLLTTAERRSLTDEILGRQMPDGAWPIESLGAFKKREDAPLSEGANAYATALAALVVQRAGIPRSDARVARALEWLRTHQDRTTGYWDAVSMNKRYEAGSMPESFMRDAATGVAVLALLEGQK